MDLPSVQGLALPHHLVSFSGGHDDPPRRGFIVIFRVLCVSPTPQLRLHALHGPHSPTLQSLGGPGIMEHGTVIDFPVETFYFFSKLAHSNYVFFFFYEILIIDSHGED